MKKIFLTLLLIISISCPLFATEVIEAETVPLETKTEIAPFKQPVSQHQLIKKFLYAMGGVAASSIILFVGLSAYNRIRSRVIKTHNNNFSSTLNSPNNFKEAVNIYLEKTKE